jgi:TRAP-type transport system periplasmic protein
MGKKKFWAIIAFFFLGIFLLGALDRPALTSTDKVFKWRLQSSFPNNSLAYEQFLKNVQEEVKKKSKGRLEIALYPPDSLVKVIETYDAVAAGAVEMALSAGAYHARKVPEANIELGIPFSFKDDSEAFDFFYKFKGGEAFKILRESYEKRGTFLVGIGPSGHYGFMTKFPVSTLEDFKGKKVRGFALFANMIQKLGAAPVSLPPAEQYLALQRGTIDGTIYPVYTLETYKLKEVVSHVVLPFLDAPLLEVYVNLKAWQSLPDDLKKIAEESIQEHFKAYSAASEKLDWTSLESAKKFGVKAVTLPDAELSKLRTLSLPLWDLAAEKSENSAKLIKLLREYLKIK